MCYKGGPRCKDEATRSLELAESKKEQAEQKLTGIKSDLQRKLAGEKVFNAKGGSRTLRGLRNEEAETLRYIASQQAKIDAAKDEIHLSPEYIEHLRERSEDTSLTPEQRSMAEVKMKNAKEERSRRILQSKQNEDVRMAVSEQMEADGFDQDTINECNPHVGSGLYLRTPKEYRKRLFAATNSIHALKTERDKELAKAATEEQQLAIREKYAPQLAEQIQGKQEAERDYYSTAAGLAELEQEAIYDPRTMSTDQWHANVLKYESFAHRNKEKQNDVRLRKLRKRRILAAYKRAGKDPAAALDALKARETQEEKTNGVPASIRPTKTGTVLLTEEGYNKIDQDHKASGSKETLAAYAKKMVLLPPQKHFQDKPLSEINKEAEQFSNGEWHRQPTHESGLRTKRIDFKLSPLEHEALKTRSSSLNTTISSYAEPILTGRDPRQVQNDRSAKSNEIKTALAEKMSAGKSKP